MTTWRSLIAKCMAEYGESWADVLSVALSAGGSFDTEFYAGYGGSNGCHFTVWTGRRVYFPVVYDGAEWVGSAPRDPCDEACAHVGGE